MAKKLRAVDQELFTFKNRKDIKSRKYKTTRQHIIDLVIGVAGILAGTALLVHFKTLVGAGVCTLAGVTLMVYAIRAEKQKQILERSEFLNALLSSALGANQKFCMIVTEATGQIVYLNNGFQKTFPKIIDLEKRNLSKLLKLYSTSDAKSKTIMTAVKKASNKTLSWDIKQGSGKSATKLKTNLQIEPIARPSGFVVIRGE